MLFLLTRKGEVVRFNTRWLWDFVSPDSPNLVKAANFDRNRGVEVGVRGIAPRIRGSLLGLARVYGIRTLTPAII